MMSKEYVQTSVESILRYLFHDLEKYYDQQTKKHFIDR